MNLQRKLCTLAASLLASGCATTPDAVHGLAETTSANVGVLGARLKQLAEESDRLYARRVANVAHLHGANERARVNYAYDVALTKKSGDKSDLDLIEELKAWVAEIDTILAASANAEQERAKTLLAGQQKIDTRSQALKKVADSLSALAKQESREERLKALRNFALAVRDEVKKELDSGEESAKSAKALVDHVASTFKAPKAEK